METNLVATDLLGGIRTHTMGTGSLRSPALVENRQQLLLQVSAMPSTPLQARYRRISMLLYLSTQVAALPPLVQSEDLSNLLDS